LGWLSLFESLQVEQYGLAMMELGMEFVSVWLDFRKL